jgi:hypothetical protein
VLVIKCGACKSKLWKYEKIGKGQVLRCHKNRITRMYAVEREEDKIKCLCGKAIGIDKGSYIKMIGKGFTHTGTKRKR